MPRVIAFTAWNIPPRSLIIIPGEHGCHNFNVQLQCMYTICGPHVAKHRWLLGTCCPSCSASSLPRRCMSQATDVGPRPGTISGVTLGLDAGSLVADIAGAARPQRCCAARSGHYRGATTRHRAWCRHQCAHGSGCHGGRRSHSG